MHTKLKKAEKISVCEHPIALQNLAVMRNKDASPELFRNATKRLAEVLFFSATDNLPTIDAEIETPLAKTIGKIIDPNSTIIIAPILRAGLVFSQVASDLLPDAVVQHIGLYRDHVTLQPIWYYNKLPKEFKEPKSTYVYILDPMLATGGSAIEAIKLYSDKKIPHENIRFICLLSSPEGLMHVQKHFPDVQIVTAWIDEKLNDKGYILPGLGDAGDRTFNTVYEV